MKPKRIVVMGFMASCPIAGVVWQHIHYIVGLQRLGHEVYYIEDSARAPYNPETYEIEITYDYAANTLRALAEEFGFAGRWAYGARYLDRHPTIGLSRKRVRELYREADAILNVCGSQDFTRRPGRERAHPLHRKRSRRGADQSRSTTNEATLAISAGAITRCSPSAKTSAHAASPSRSTA